MMALEIKRVVTGVTLTPLCSKRLENWSMGFMWPWAGKDTTMQWALQRFSIFFFCYGFTPILSFWPGVFFSCQFVGVLWSVGNTHQLIIAVMIVFYFFKGIKLIFLFLKIYFYRNHNKKSKNIIKIVKETKNKKKKKWRTKQI